MKRLVTFFGTMATLTCSVALAAAGHDQGNGGNVVACGHQIELVDHYEARVLRGIKIDLGDASLSVMEKVTLAISRIEKLNPNRAKLYKLWAGQFFSETLFTDDELIPLPDNGPGTIPSGCVLKQIAIQQTPNLPGDYRYIIKQSLWDKLDNDGKAGLVLHEIIYRELINQKYLPHTTSKFARYFNALLSSDVFSTIRLKSYIGILNLLDFERGDAQHGTEIGFYRCSSENICIKWLPSFLNDDIVQAGVTPIHYSFTDSSVAYWRGNFVKITNDDVRFTEDGELTGIIFYRDPMPLQMGPINVSLERAERDSLNEMFEDGDGATLFVLTGRAKFKWQNKDVNCAQLKVSWRQKTFQCSNGIQGGW